MISKSKFSAILLLGLLGACGASTSSSGSPVAQLRNGETLKALSGANVMALSVNGTECGTSASYPNKPCVSVTICTVDGSSCQTVNNILLDSGSFGLRVFKSALGGISLPAE